MTLFQMTTLAGAYATAGQTANTRDHDARKTSDARPGNRATNAASPSLLQSLLAGLTRLQSA